MVNCLILLSAAFSGFMISRLLWVGWEMARRVVVFSAYKRHYQEIYGRSVGEDGPHFPSFSWALYGIFKLPPYYFMDFDNQIQEFYHDNQSEFVRLFMEKSDVGR